MADTITTMKLVGRDIIYADSAEITADNIGEILQKAKSSHDTNRTAIDYLYKYYKGDQPILNREKIYNPDINNKVVENEAHAITDFKTGYFLSAPIQYIDAANNDAAETYDNSDLIKLSGWCTLKNMDAVNLEVATWQSICGLGYKMVVPNDNRIDDDDAPFIAYSLDPRDTFCIYSSRLGHKKLAGVTYVTLQDNSIRYYVYTDKDYFVLNDNFEDASDDIDKSGSHSLGAIPIFEYPLNAARIGDFEIVIALLDALNNVQSNRVDGIEQIIQSILCLEGVEIMPEADETQAEAEANFMKQLKEVGGLLLPKDAKAYYLTNQLNQGDTQTLKDDIYKSILRIVGIPDRSNGSTNGDTGSAIMLRNGFAEAEARAKNTETYFKKSEREFLNLLINICNTIGGTNILPSDVDIRFPRRNYTNDSANVSNLVTMLSNEWITPEFAYLHSNLTPDPHKDYLLAKEWHDKQESNEIDSLMKQDDDVESKQPARLDNGEPVLVSNEGNVDEGNNEGQ